MLSPRKHVSSELKSKILSELCSSGRSVSELAKKYGLRSKRLYQWRSKCSQSTNGDESSSNKKVLNNSSNFVELLPTPEPTCANLSAQITLNNVDLSISGRLSSSKLLSIIKILGE